MLARALKSDIAADMKELVDPMLATGLSPPLTSALRQLADEVPAVAKDIQVGHRRVWNGHSLVDRSLYSFSPTW